MRRDHDDQFGLLMTRDLSTEEPAEKGKVSEHGRLRHVLFIEFLNEAADRDRIARLDANCLRGAANGNSRIALGSKSYRIADFRCKIQGDVSVVADKCSELQRHACVDLLDLAKREVRIAG